jgi:hypothetical protein
MTRKAFLPIILARLKVFCNFLAERVVENFIARQKQFQIDERSLFNVPIKTLAL